nr:MAG TPA: hypothetical protein [Caudoviricetes sp.]
MCCFRLPSSAPGGDPRRTLAPKGAAFRLSCLVGGIDIRVGVSTALRLPAAALTFGARQSFGLAAGDALPAVTSGQLSAANGIAEAVFVGKVAGIPHKVGAAGGGGGSSSVHMILSFCPRWGLSRFVPLSF